MRFFAKVPKGVVKTLPLDMLLSQGLGMAFSLAQGEKEQEKSSVFATEYFRVGLLFHLVVAFGVALLCYILHPDWMLMYYGDHRKIPRAIIAYIFSGYFAMYTLGFFTVPHLRRIKRELPWAAFFSLLAFIFAFIGLSFHRLWNVGTYHEYHDGTAAPVTRTSLFPVLGLSMPGAVGGLALVLKKLDERHR